MVWALTNDISVSVSPNTNTSDFSSTLPEYKTILRAPFRGWAEDALPLGEHHGI